MFNVFQQEKSEELAKYSSDYAAKVKKAQEDQKGKQSTPSPVLTVVLAKTDQLSEKYRARIASFVFEVSNGFLVDTS